MVGWPYSVSAMTLQPISGLTLRRALIGILLDARRPLTVAEVVAALSVAGVTTPPRAKPINMVIADMLAYQVRIGRVARVHRATYATIPSSMSRSMRHRCRHWRDRLD
ncbi:MAG: hypothetical protein K8R99_07895 [Actinomycetia bacterium]|nr:hypothetical protein [Actinomycetes bacterium]